ncbi:MAG: hypothetical protein ACOC2H_06160 [Spirochaetota bacterium]
MEITLMQAIIIFWSSLFIWVLVEYLFYRMQHNAHNRSVQNTFSGSQNKPIM